MRLDETSALTRHVQDEQNVSTRTRQFVLDRDDRKCQYCEEEDVERLTLHHVIYRSLLGSHSPENLVTLCWRCHREVHNKNLLVKLIAGTWYFRNLKANWGLMKGRRAIAITALCQERYKTLNYLTTRRTSYAIRPEQVKSCKGVLEHDR